MSLRRKPTNRGPVAHPDYCFDNDSVHLVHYVNDDSSLFETTVVYEGLAEAWEFSMAELQPEAWVSDGGEGSDTAIASITSALLRFGSNWRDTVAKRGQNFCNNTRSIRP